MKLSPGGKSRLLSLAAILIGLVLVVISGALFWGVSPPSPQTNKPRVTPAQINLAPGAVGENRTCTLDLVNPFNHVIYDLVLSTTCGCVLIDELDIEELEVGGREKLRIEVEFPKSAGFKEVLIHSKYSVKGTSFDELTQILLESKAS